MSQYQQHSRTAASASDQRPTGQRFPTESYLSEEVRRAIVDRLNRTLADATVLQTHAKFAHWNVKGMSFYGLHLLFDEIAEDLESHVDLLAERITALGGQALGTAGMAAEFCRLPAMPTDAVTDADYVDVVAERLAAYDANLAADIREANRLEDVDTADLLNEISREASKDLWFVEAHRQTRPLGSGWQAQPARGQQTGSTEGQFQGAPRSRPPASEPDVSSPDSTTPAAGDVAGSPGGEPDPTQIQRPGQAPTPNTR